LNVYKGSGYNSNFKLYLMKNTLLKIKNARLLSKKQQKIIIGGMIPPPGPGGDFPGNGGGNGGGGSSNCTVTGCVSGGFISGGNEGSPCGLGRPNPEVCIGTVINGQCCGPFF